MLRSELSSARRASAVASRLYPAYSVGLSLIVLRAAAILCAAGERSVLAVPVMFCATANAANVIIVDMINILHRAPEILFMAGLILDFEVKIVAATASSSGHMV